MTTRAEQLSRDLLADQEEDVRFLQFLSKPGAYLYLATPYTKYPAGRQQAADDAANLVAVLTRLGISVISPIVHWHVVDKFGRFGDDPDFWLSVNVPLLRGAAALVVAMMPGWDASTGVYKEISFAERNGLWRSDLTIPSYLLGLPPA